MRKPKAGTLKRPPSRQELPNPNVKKIATNKVVAKRPAPTGPDYEGPYSRYGTAGPVNETVSKVRDILRYDDNGLPIPYRKKGGATNKKNTTMKKLVKADKGIQIGKKKSTVSVTQDVDGKNVPFTGTVKENKRKAIMEVSNPDYGSTKTIEKFGRKGNLKSQIIFDRDASNKLSKITRNKVDKEGNIQSSVPYQSQKKGGATKALPKALPKAGPGRIIKAVGKVIKNKAAKAVKKLDGNPERFARNVGGLGLAYVLGAKAGQRKKTAFFPSSLP